MAKCSDCGFLAVRDRHNMQLICEATAKCRAGGYHHDSNDRSTPANFFCYVNSPAFPSLAKLSEPYATHQPRGNPVSDRAAMLATEIECSEFFAWRPGKPPKEHEDMHLLRELENRTNAWRTEDLRWQKQVEALAETRHQENRRDLTEQSAKNLRAAWWGIAVAILAAVLSLVAAGIGVLPWLLSTKP